MALNQPRSLMIQSAARIPFEDIPFIPLYKKAVIHRVLSPFVVGIGTRQNRKKPLESYCNCGKECECLCYFSGIRTDAIENWWGTEDAWQFLGDWCRFPQHQIL